MMRSRLTALLLAFLVLALAGCERGPAPAVLQADMQAALDAMEANLLHVVSLRPQGSGPGAAADETIAYANVIIELRRDHDFGAWGGINIGTLASTLGATASGVRGVKSSGNVAGDRLSVYASASYAVSDEGWRYLGGSAPQPSSAPPGAAVAADDGSLIGRVEAILAQGEESLGGERDRLARGRLRVALSELKRSLDPADIVIAGGPAGGEYERLALALTEPAAKHGLRMVVRRSQGSVENVRLLNTAEVTLAIVQGDVLALAYTADGPFAFEPPAFDVVALAALYPEPVQVMVRAEDTLDSVRDLAGRRVGLGLPGSGAAVVARRVLAAHGLTLAQLGFASFSAPRDAHDMLARGELDAVFAVTGAPADTIRALAARRPIRLLSLDPAAVQQLVSQQRTYVRFTIPRSTYRTQTEPAHSIATSAILVARRDLADALVEKVLRALYADVDYAGAGSLMGSLVSSRSAGIGLPVPLHLAAQRYHESLAQ